MSVSDRLRRPRMRYPAESASSVFHLCFLPVCVHSLSSYLATFLLFFLSVDPVEYDGCVGVLIPSPCVTDSLTLSLWSRDHVFSRFTLSVSFPSFGINNARWRLCCSYFPAGFSRNATAGDSAGELEKLTSCWSIFPKRVTPSAL